MFLIVFKTGHALPLAGARLLRPRSNRGEHAEQPCGVCGSLPRARQIRDLDSAEDRTRTQTVRVREQSTSALSPRKQARPQTGRVFGDTADSTAREPATATDSIYPPTVLSRGLSMPANWSRAQSVPERGLATNSPRRCIAVSILPPISFPVRIHFIPAYDLV